MLSFQILDKAIKFSNNTSSIVKVSIAIRLKGSLYPVFSVSREFKSGEWWVPIFDYTGCSIVSVYDFDTLKELQRIVLPRHFYDSIDKQNVICVGLNKSGTTSFSSGLQSLGYSLYPEPVGHNTLLPDVYHRTYGSTLSALENERYNLYQDMPFSLPGFYKEVYKMRPNDIYVLTIRDSVEKFVDTCLNFYRRQFSYGDINKFDENLFYRYTHSNVVTVHLDNLYYSQFDLWGIKTFDNIEKKLTDVYNKHIDNVVDFFEGNNIKNFKVINVSKENELENIAKWLGKESEEKNFPWLNKRN
jgi:hypothetical protein